MSDSDESNGSGVNISGLIINSNTPPNVEQEDDKYGPKAQCLEALKRWDLEVGDPIVFDKTNAERGTVCAGDQETVLASNVFGLRTTKMTVYQYHVEFTKVLTRGRTPGSFPLVSTGNNDKKGKDSNEPERKVRVKVPDYTAYQNRQMHRKLLEAFMAKYPNVFGSDPDCFCYDFAATLFSIASYETSMSLEEEETIEAIDRPYKVILVLKKPADNVFNVRDLMKNHSLDLSAEPNQIIRFLELATARYASQHPEDHVMYEAKKTYFMNPGKFGFSSPDLNNGKYLAPGASKTIVCVEGPRNKGAPAVIVESKKTPFYHSMNLLELVCVGLKVKPNIRINPEQFTIAGKYLKRLEVFPVYGGRQRTPLTLSSFDNHNAVEATIDQDGNVMTVAAYFKQRYNVDLRFPQWPLAKAQKKVAGHYPLYPVELLYVADYQRVGNGNITSTDIAVIVKACAVTPFVKSGEIVKCYQSFCFNIDQFMKKAGLEVLENPLEVKARVLKAPRIEYANGGLNPEQNGKWRLPRQAKYVRCSGVKTWCALFLLVRGECMTLNQFKQFVFKYHGECRHRGLDMPPAVQVWETGCTAVLIEEAFRSASQEGGCEFILIGHSDRDSNFHPLIKGMERKYNLISQCVRTKTIVNVMTKSPLSLENIVAKTNVKLGGHNYDLVLDNFCVDPNVLFIGLGMNHPAGGMSTEGPSSSNGSPIGSDGSIFPSNVSVLGFAANDGVTPNEFIGNFFFSPMHRDEKLSVLDKLLEEIFERFHANRKAPPSRIVFYRSGCDEGGYSSALRYEIPVIVALAKKYAPDAPVTVIVPSKMHSFRFFKKDINPSGRSDDQNIRPGTVLDEGVVNSAFCEFYLNSHLALQGTAKTTKYTVIYSSEKDFKLDMFERWTNALAYDFQIVTSPTSLPAPVYVAQRYAERGRQIYNTFPTSDAANLIQPDTNGNGTNGNGFVSSGSSNGSGSNGNGSNGSGSNGNVVAAKPVRENKYYTKSLHYNFTKREDLRDKRVNA